MINRLTKQINLINNLGKMLKQEDFIGEFQNEHYKIFKDYIDTEVDQIRLFHTRYKPPTPKYTICIVHGFGEHSTRFHPIADFFAKNQFEVLMVDLRGFGYSGGARGCAEVRQLQNDVICLLKTARSDLPLFLYGHSMGGLVVIKLLLDRSNINVSGCIITSPLLGFPKNMHFSWGKKKMLSLLGEDLSDFIINSKVNPTALTKKTKYLYQIFEDRMMLPFLSVKMAKYLFEAVESVKARQNEFRYPVIIFHGKLDTVTNYEDSRAFIYNKASASKQFHLFPQGYHELQHDNQRDQMLDRTLQFVKKQTNLKNFGPMMVHPIKKPTNSRKPWLKIVLILIAVLVIIRKIKSKLGK